MMHSCFLDSRDPAETLPLGNQKHSCIFTINSHFMLQPIQLLLSSLKALKDFVMHFLIK